MNELKPHYLPLTKKNFEEIQYALAQSFGTDNKTYLYIQNYINEQVSRGLW